MFYKSRLASFLTLIFMLVLVSMPIFPADEVGKSATADINNIGFMQNPPKELKEKFPMCDAFLKVEWIDKGKMIGFSHYEAQLFNDNGLLSTEKKDVWALVKLDDMWPSYNMDIYQYQQQGRMSELVDLVKNGKQLGNDIVFQIKYKEDTKVFYKHISPVLSDHRQTVCIAYPDRRKVWIIEGKSVQHAYSDSQLKTLLSRFEKTGKPFDSKLLKEHWILDINYDNKDDFVTDILYGLVGFIGYTWMSEIYQENITVQYPDYLLSFPPGNHTCRIKIEGIFPLTTDGKNYFISNQCNLTKLTSVIEKG